MGLELANHMEEGLSEIPDFDVSDKELVSHVRHALQSVSSTEGNSDNYNELILALNKNHRLTDDDVAFLVTSLKALRGAISDIDIVKHEALLSAIFRMNMWWYGEDVMNALVELIIALANGPFHDPCLDMLVCNFMPPISELPKLKKESRSSKKNQVLDCVHSALKNITDLVPLTPMRLLPIVLQRMPQKFAKEELLVVYVESMLRLESSSIGEALRETILMALVDRMIELDVEIEWDGILLDDWNKKGIFDMELEDVEETADYAEKDGDKAVAEKLDSLMVLTCEHLKSCSDNGRLIKIFGILLDSFQITVLDTYRSKFTQFVIFYACSLDPEICGMRFAFMLADIFVCRENPSLRRMSAVAYLASYLSRGRFLESSFIIDILNRLVNWCCKYCDRTVNPEDPRVFYSACQAIMYVLCFRMKAMLSIPHLKSQLLHFPLELIFQHPLDPLKVCLPSIVWEFLKQAEAVGLFTQTSAVSEDDFIFKDLLESDLSKAYGGMERLDMFFPFDPCLLRNCDRFIRPNFVYWSMVRPPRIGLEGMTSDEDVNDHVADGNFSDDDDDVMGRSYNNDPDLNLDEFENSLNKMSITPKSTLKYSMAAGGFQNQMRMPARIRPSTSPESL